MIEITPDVREVYEDELGYEFGYKEGNLFRVCFYKTEIKPEFINNPVA